MSTPLEIMHNALQWLYDQSMNLDSMLFPCTNQTQIRNQILLGSTIGIAGIVTIDFVYGYKQFLYGNNLVERRVGNPHC